MLHPLQSQMPHTDSKCVQGKEEATEAALSLLLDTGLGEEGWVPSGDKKGVKIYRRNASPFTSLKGTGRHLEQSRSIYGALKDPERGIQSAGGQTEHPQNMA